MFNIKGQILILLFICGYTGLLAQLNFDWRSNFDSITSEEGKIDFLINTARKKIVNNDTALFMHKKAVAISEQINNPSLKAKCLRSMGAIYLNMGEYEKIAENFQEALNIAQNQNDSDAISEAFNGLGVAAEKMKKHQEAIKNYLKSLSYTDSTSTIYRITLRNIGNIYQNWKKYDLAIEYYHKSLELCKKLAKNNSDSTYIAYNFQSLGSTFAYMGIHDSSLYYKHRSLDMFKKLDFKRGIMEGSVNLAITYKDLGRLDEARDIFNSILTSKDIESDSLTQAIILINLASVYSKEENFIKAALTAHRAFNILSNNNFDLEAQIAATQTASRNYYLGEDYKKAMEVSSVMFGLKDSLYDMQSFEAMAELERKYDSEKKEKENLLLKQQKLEQEQKASSRLLIIVILGFIVFLFGILFWTKQRRDKIKKEKLLLESEKQISDLKHKALNTQINSHFLFNAISIAENFIKKDQANKGQKILNDITRLIRFSLENCTENFISLEDEVNVLTSYLELCKQIYENSISYQIHFDISVDQEMVKIPPMLIQPFIENAVIHGIAPKNDKGEIIINFKIENNILLCSIKDNGIGRSKESKTNINSSKRKSLGMQITTDRLTQINKSGIKNSIEPSIKYRNIKEEGSTGTEVIIPISLKAA